jgi:hypothetical protein
MRFILSEIIRKYTSRKDSKETQRSKELLINEDSLRLCDRMALRPLRKII